jgi:VIT1/CCC1 family predicted Fe2+/Mn2+ transporter
LRSLEAKPANRTSRWKACQIAALRRHTLIADNITEQLAGLRKLHAEHHRIHHPNWLRAAVLGANDGIVSTASLIVGIAAANATRGSIILAGTAGLVAGAMSMAAGEYVSVKSQEDTERADLDMEAKALSNNPQEEEQELADIYRNSMGAVVPVLTAAVVPFRYMVWLVPALAIVLLGVLGALAARTGGAPPLRAAVRVCFWGTLAMALTALIGKLFGIAAYPK